jgi:probable HAF family extracellular repeat protein
LGDLPGGVFNSSAYGVSADGTVVAGYGESSSGFEAFRWTPSLGMVGLGDLPGGGFSSAAYAITPDGTVIAGRSQSAFGFEAMRWTQTDGMQGLGDLPGGTFEAAAYGMSASGNMIVGYGSTSLGREAFVWDPANGMRNLKQVLVDEFGLNLTGWQLSSANAISDDGTTIVGTGTNPIGRGEAWRAVIPEPASLALLVMFLLTWQSRRAGRSAGLLRRQYGA